ncbi:spore coat protein YsxE [Bacillus sp. DJP31]|uniref:spore coat protein YsxE n=1 Tax=Bacillus sp. DJP31 TaxID=3409789 RepID=UPI003BB7D55C
MTADLRYKYQPLLTEYGIDAEYIEDYGTIKKVHSNQGTLALKKTKLPQTKLAEFEERVRFLQYKSYGFGVPIYRTRTGSVFVFDHEQAAYYLMPWLEENEDLDRNDHAFQLFKSLGELHAKTITEEKITSEEVNGLVQSEKEKWKQRKEELELFVEKCEEQTYMSPFELYFCTYYQEMTRASDFAMRKLDEWQELMSEKDMYRLVLTHGKPSFTHYLYNTTGKGLFINFEQGNHFPPVYDLLYFFYRSCKTYPIQTDDRFQWFQTYQLHCPLNDEEITLFTAQLSYPENMFQVVDRYRRNKQSKSEIKHVQLLQRAYWQMKNIEVFLTSIVMFEEKKKQQESQMES